MCVIVGIVIIIMIMNSSREFLGYTPPPMSSAVYVAPKITNWFLRRYTATVRFVQCRIVFQAICKNLQISLGELRLST